MFDVQAGYNNICIKEGNQHKAAFITPLGLFEPMVMFFGLCNAPATFQDMMDRVFDDLVCEDSLSSTWMTCSSSPTISRNTGYKHVESYNGYRNMTSTLNQKNANSKSQKSNS